MALTDWSRFDRYIAQNSRAGQRFALPGRDFGRVTCIAVVLTWTVAVATSPIVNASGNIGAQSAVSYYGSHVSREECAAALATREASVVERLRLEGGIVTPRGNSQYSVESPLGRYSFTLTCVSR